MSFSEKKFTSFDISKQKKELFKLLKLIEENYQNEPVREIKINEFNNLLGYISYSKSSFLSNLEEISLHSTLREITVKIMSFNEELERNEKDSDFIIEKYDGENSNKKRKSQLVVILDNLRSAFNVGSIFRTSECFGVNKLYLSGYTPNPKNRKVVETSMGTTKYLNYELIKSTEKKIAELKNLGYKIYSFETVNSAKNLFDVKFEEKSCFIFGNEALGIPEDIIKKSDEIVKIPVLGWKNSLNVGVSFSVGVYEYLKQFRGENK